MPCPHCGPAQTVVVEQLADDGRYCCFDCGRLIDEDRKTEMLAAGSRVPSFPDRRIRGYQLNALYSLAGLGYAWAEVAELRAAAAADPSGLMNERPGNELIDFLQAEAVMAFGGLPGHAARDLARGLC